jgi:hypothetical protein
MNYQKIYNQIIERAKNRVLEDYKEKHHIVPKCLGGSNEKENLVELTAREHFLCHILLCEIYPNETKLKYALYLMNIGKQKHKDADYRITSRIYERLKKEHSLLMIGNQTRKGIKCSDETKRKIGEKNKHNKPEGFGKKHDGYGDIIKETWKVEGRKENQSEKMKQSWSNKNRKENQSEKMKQSWEGRTRQVIQLDLDNNIIKEWNSVTEAFKSLNKTSGMGNIHLCCTGKYKTAHGYKWKYK